MRHFEGHRPVPSGDMPSLEDPARGHSPAVLGCRLSHTATRSCLSRKPRVLGPACMACPGMIFYPAARGHVRWDTCYSNHKATLGSTKRKWGLGGQGCWLMGGHGTLLDGSPSPPPGFQENLPLFGGPLPVSCLHTDELSGATGWCRARGQDRLPRPKDSSQQL